MAAHPGLTPGWAVPQVIAYQYHPRDLPKWFRCFSRSSVISNVPDRLPLRPYESLGLFKGGENFSFPPAPIHVSAAIMHCEQSLLDSLCRRYPGLKGLSLELPLGFAAFDTLRHMKQLEVLQLRLGNLHCSGNLGAAITDLINGLPNLRKLEIKLSPTRHHSVHASPTATVLENEQRHTGRRSPWNSYTLNLGRLSSSSLTHLKLLMTENAGCCWDIQGADTWDLPRLSKLYLIPCRDSEVLQDLTISCPWLSKVVCILTDSAFLANLAEHPPFPWPKLEIGWADYYDFYDDHSGYPSSTASRVESLLERMPIFNENLISLGLQGNIQEPVEWLAALTSLTKLKLDSVSCMSTFSLTLAPAMVSAALCPSLTSVDVDFLSLDPKLAPTTAEISGLLKYRATLGWTEGLAADGLMGELGPLHKAAGEVDLEPLPEGIDLDRVCRHRDVLIEDLTHNLGSVAKVQKNLLFLKGMDSYWRKSAWRSVVGSAPTDVTGEDYYYRVRVDGDMICKEPFDLMGIGVSLLWQLRSLELIRGFYGVPLSELSSLPYLEKLGVHCPFPTCVEGIQSLAGLTSLELCGAYQLPSGEARFPPALKVLRLYPDQDPATSSTVDALELATKTQLQVLAVGANASVRDLQLLSRLVGLRHLELDCLRPSSPVNVDHILVCLSGLTTLSLSASLRPATPPLPQSLTELQYLRYAGCREDYDDSILRPPVLWKLPCVASMEGYMDHPCCSLLPSKVEEVITPDRSLPIFHQARVLRRRIAQASTHNNVGGPGASTSTANL